MVRRLGLLGCLGLAGLPAIAAPPSPLLPLSSAWSHPVSREVSDLRLQHGDDPRWAAKGFDASDWKEITIFDLPSRDGVYWIRWRVTQREAAPPYPFDGVLLKVVASYDLYWDGRLIGRNGRVGVNARDEQPGNVDSLFQIPDELLGSGEHVLAMRISSFHTGFPRDTYMLVFQWGNFRSMLVERVRTATFSVMAVGAAVVAAIVFGLMWLLASRRLPLLLFTALASCVAVVQTLQAWRWLYDYPYSWHHPRLLVITALFTVMAVLLPAFLMHQFGVGNRKWVYGILAVLATASWVLTPTFYGAISMNLCATGLVMSLAISARAVRLRRRGAICACAGLAMSFGAAVCVATEFLDHAFFISTGPAAIGLLMALVLQLRDERREAQQAVLAAARLEVELLKKNIQPHFLLNTLATIMEVIEREPKIAVAMIEALANEFRVLARVSGEKLIPLAQELELCRAHLDVMSLRKGARCSLAVQGERGDEVVPPALFHTLIENGLTHLLPSGGRQDFALNVAHLPGVTRYVLLARGERQAATGEMREGTGLRYIKARLAESFTGHWSIAGAAVPEGWETVIAIRPAGSGASPERAVRPGAAAVPGIEEPA